MPDVTKAYIKTVKQLNRIKPSFGKVLIKLPVRMTTENSFHYLILKDEKLLSGWISAMCDFKHIFYRSGIFLLFFLILFRISSS